MRITTDKEEYGAGESIKAEVWLDLANPSKARAIVAMLVCDECRRVETVREISEFERQHRKELGLFSDTHMKKSVHEENHIVHEQKKQVAGEGTYYNENFAVEFKLPQNAPLTSHEFGEDKRKNVWKLLVKIDIPLAPDVNASREILVRGHGEDY